MEKNSNREIIEGFLLFLCCLGNVFSQYCLGKCAFSTFFCIAWGNVFSPIFVLLGEMRFLLFCIAWGNAFSPLFVLLGEMRFLLFLYCLGKCVFSSFCQADVVVVSHWGRCFRQSCNQAQCVSNLPTVDCWFSHLCKIRQGRYLLQAVLGCLSYVIHKAHMMNCASCLGVSLLHNS